MSSLRRVMRMRAANCAPMAQAISRVCWVKAFFLVLSTFRMPSTSPSLMSGTTILLLAPVSPGT